MSTDAAEERDSQPAQRDELAHSRIVPTRGGVLPPANDPSPTAITENTGSHHGLHSDLTPTHYGIGSETPHLKPTGFESKPRHQLSHNAPDATAPSFPF